MDQKIRTAARSVCLLFAAFTVILLVVQGQYGRLPLALATFALVLLPNIMERLCGCRFSLGLYLFAVLYAIGPMLGHCHNFYYILPGWDKLLHICGGVMFAILGLYLYEVMAGDRKNRLLGLIFALCFSMAVAVMWEFIEFASDRLLGTDMQNDTLITAIHSYLLAEGHGVAGSIENIQSVTVNGIAMPGYIDIGLFDTVLDMLLESLGALGFCVGAYLDKGKHPVIRHTGKINNC